MDHAVFIQANEKQMLGAIVAEYARRRNSGHNDKFDSHIMNYDDIPVFRQREGHHSLDPGGIKHVAERNECAAEGQSCNAEEE